MSALTPTPTLEYAAKADGGTPAMSVDLLRAKLDIAALRLREARDAHRPLRGKAAIHAVVTDLCNDALRDIQWILDELEDLRLDAAEREPRGPSRPGPSATGLRASPE